jgi:hypothetical protein
MYCPQCQAATTAEAHFCARCGAFLSGAVPQRTTVSGYTPKHIAETIFNLRAALEFISNVRSDSYATPAQKIHDLASMDAIKLDENLGMDVLGLSDARWQAVSQEANMTSGACDDWHYPIRWPYEAERAAEVVSHFRIEEIAANYGEFVG